MSDPTEELQESQALSSLRSRSGARGTENIETRDDYQELYGSDQDNRLEEDYEGLCQTLENLLEDLTACDVQLSLFIAASSSYRQDTTLRPFPPMFLDQDQDEVKDVAGLTRMLDQLPSLENLRRDLKGGKLDLERKTLQLIVWILRGGTSNLKLRTLSEAERLKVSDCEGMKQ